jgi:modulator of FtsH protease HflC
MRFKILLTLAVLLLVAAVALPSALFTVDRTEFVYLTQFGRHVATFDGANDEQAGLHFKWPWPVQSVQRLDRRLQHFDLAGAELLTRDPRRNTIDKTLTIDAYVCWRIADADGVDRFIRRVGTAEGAQAILGQRVGSELGAAVGQMELDDLIAVGPGKVDRQRERLRERLLEGSDAGGRSLREVAREDYGIEVVDLRLRRLNHPAAVQQAIFERIRSEREKKAADYISEGQRLAEDIRSASDRRVSEMRAQAEAEAIRLRGLADAEADKIRNEAQSKDPQFYAFLKKLEEYQRMLGDNKSVLLLSTHRELFDVLFNPPSPGGVAPAKSPPPAPPGGPITTRRGGP